MKPKDKHPVELLIDLRKLERKFFISVILLLLATILFTTFRYKQDTDTLFRANEGLQRDLNECYNGKEVN